MVYTHVQEDCVSSSQTGSLNQIGMALSNNIMVCLRSYHIHVTGIDRLHIMHLLSLTTLLLCSVVCNELLSKLSVQNRYGCAAHANTGYSWAMHQDT